MTNWKPIRVRVSEDTSAYDGPHEGVPDWMFNALWEWTEKRYPLTNPTVGGGYERPEARSDYRRLSMALGVALENTGPYTGAAEMQYILKQKALVDRQLLIEVADYWLQFDSKNGAAAMQELDRILADSRSAWRVQKGAPPLLTRRVDQAVQASADALQDGSQPGELLMRAWRAIYGRTPNPSEGYREAIKAVEAAAGPVVSQSNARRTLGTIIRDLEAKPDKWTVRLQGDDPNAQTRTVIEMLDLLWTGQTGRHADVDPTAPLDVSQEDAEAALHLALTLVHWFKTGVVAAR